MDIVRREKSIIDYVSKSVKDLSDIYGEKTYFRDLVSKIVQNTVAEGKWFGFGARVNTSQTDILALKNNKGISFGSMILNELDMNDKDRYRVSLYRYLLSDYLCYCEIPTVTKQRDYSGFKDSYSKSLITCNISVIAEWLETSYADAKMNYAGCFDDDTFDRDDDLCRYVKLTVSKDGVRKVTKPRKELDLSQKGLRIVPLFAIIDGIESLYKKCSDDFYNVSFVKDSGQVRTINICFNHEKLCEVYKDKGLLADAFEQQFDGENVNISHIERGYIRVIEVGTSLKSGPVRALNVARILSVERAEPDLTFIDIELDTVKDKFLGSLITNKLNYKEFTDMLEVLQVGNGGVYDGKKLSSYSELESWVNQQETLLSTPFIKQLALFMIGNPQWFNSVKPANNDFGSDDSDDGDVLNVDLDFDID